MISLFITVAVLASASAIPLDGGICQKYQYLYDQCLPPTNWMCDKPLDYTPLDIHGLKEQLRLGDNKFVQYLSTCSECLGDPTYYGEKVDYKKQPVCREVKVPVEYVNKTVYNQYSGQPMGYEVCQVVLNSGQRNVQRVYRTECYNGNIKRKDQYCNFDYGVFKQYFCRPTNFVYREMLVFCPSTGLQYYKEKVSTACSCVRMKCVH